MTVLAANNWPSNAELIADVASLYLDENMRILDATYGEGKWWTRWAPHALVKNDKFKPPEYEYGYAFDFRHFPESWDDLFDVVAYDPPYVCKGGRHTSGITEMDGRYGIGDENTPKSPAALQVLINDGLDGCKRVVKPGGLILVKCKDYISSGKLWSGTYETERHARWLSLDVVDRLEHIGAPGPQPHGRRQVHARRNLSTLFVFRKP